MRPFSILNFVCLTFIFLTPYYLIASQRTKVAEISYETTSPTRIKAGEDKPQTTLPSEIFWRRTTFNTMVPIPVPFLWGMLVGNIRYYDELRSFSAQPEQITTSSEPGGLADRDLRRLATGLLYLHHPGEGAPKFFIMANRYDHPDIKKMGAPMGEYIIGTDLDDDDLPFHIRWLPSDQSEFRFLLRLRQFPGFRSWLPLAGWRLTMGNGFYYELYIPSHLTIGWRFEESEYFFSARLESKEAPLDLQLMGSTSSSHTMQQRFWAEGHTTTFTLGMRRKLFKPLYLVSELGMQSDQLEYRNRDGDLLASIETDYAPYIRLAIETWIDTP